MVLNIYIFLSFCYNLFINRQIEINYRKELILLDVNDIKNLSEAAKNISEIIKEPIHNLTDKPTKNIGNGLADIFELIFAPVKAANIYAQHKIFKFRQELEEKINNIPDNKKVEPPINVVGPVLEASRFYIDETEIRSMFTNLIVAAMHEDECNYVHPAFVEIIKQLRPLDAHIFSLLYENPKTYPIANIIDTEIPISSINDCGHTIFIRNFIPLEIVNVKNFKTIEASIDNLIRLNLITVYYDRVIDDESVYNSIESNIVYTSLKTAVLNKYLVGYQKGSWSITAFGKDFAKVCL